MKRVTNNKPGPIDTDVIKELAELKDQYTTFGKGKKNENKFPK